ncbi:uncharacterized protein LOC135811226 isoform X2 [Sycon ciliatum]|uniref:uncharacterized protein LOC135811226 isoform X2 n=1 Tax=Sycon ciliatum TaxID=27933 RepID=UPI0031F65CDF
MRVCGRMRVCVCVACACACVLLGLLAAALSARAEHLIANSVATGTQRTYAPGWRSFLEFRGRMRRDTHHPDQNDVLLFAAAMSHSVRASTLRVYLAAIKYHLLRMGGPVGVTSSSRITALLMGLERERASLPRHPSARPQRQAITVHQLKALRQFLNRSLYSPADRLMLWAALTTAFHGLLLCVSEYTSLSPHGPGGLKTLRHEHLRLAQQEASLQLQRTKTSQLATGGEVALNRYADPALCPVRALQAYVRSSKWSNDKQPLFKFQDGRHLKPNDINAVLHKVLGPSISSHSLRVGGATHMAD